MNVKMWSWNHVSWGPSSATLPPSRLQNPRCRLGIALPISEPQSLYLSTPFKASLVGASGPHAKLSDSAAWALSSAFKEAQSREKCNAMAPGSSPMPQGSACQLQGNVQSRWRCQQPRTCCGSCFLGCRCGIWDGGAHSLTLPSPDLRSLCLHRDLLPFTLRLPQAVLEANSYPDLETISNLGLGKSVLCCLGDPWTLGPEEMGRPCSCAQ